MSAQLKSKLILPEDRANGYGQWLTYLNRTDEAIELFRWNTQTYPTSLNAFDVLGQAEEQAGNIQGATASFEIALNISKEKNLPALDRFKSTVKRLNNIIENNAY